MPVLTLPMKELTNVRIDRGGQVADQITKVGSADPRAPTSRLFRDMRFDSWWQFLENVTADLFGIVVLELLTFFCHF
jgi:hypothetical protein